MKHFSKKIIIFILSSVLCVIPISVLDLLLSQLRPKSYLSSWNDLYTNNINSDLVIFGTSRAQEHIVSSIVSDSLGIKVYNLGGKAHPIEMQLIRLKELLKTCDKKPNIISLECCFLSIYDCNGIEKTYQLYPWMFGNKMLEHYTVLLRQSYSKYDFIVPLWRYKHGLASFISESMKYGDSCDNGYYNRNKERNLSEFNLGKRNLKFDIHPKRVEYLKEFLETCKQNNIKIGIIYTPEYYWQELYVNKQEIIDTIKKVANYYNVPFKDFSEDSIPINTDSLYYSDYSHLTDKGARKFTSECYIPYIKQLYGL